VWINGTAWQGKGMDMAWRAMCESVFRRVWKDNIKMSVKETAGLRGVLDCIHLAEGGE
jgi:hypothetical protein